MTRVRVILCTGRFQVRKKRIDWESEWGSDTERVLMACFMYVVAGWLADGPRAEDFRESIAFVTSGRRDSNRSSRYGVSFR